MGLELEGRLGGVDSYPGILFWFCPASIIDVCHVINEVTIIVFDEQTVILKFEFARMASQVFIAVKPLELEDVLGGFLSNEEC